MNYLKIVSKGFETYNGQLNIITFKNGVSTEPVQPLIAKRISACMTVVACDAEGNEGEVRQFVGVQHSLINDTLMRAPISAELKRQTEADRSMEAKLDAARSLEAPTEALYSQEDLETLADKSGIKGLREVGDAWSVSARSIPDLIAKILAAQAEFTAKRNLLAETASETVLKATTLATEADLAETSEPVVEDVPEPAGYADLAAEYVVGDVTIPAATLIDAALKNCGKSLTGWNTLRDSERKIFLDREFAALETHYGAKLEPVEVPSQEPTDEDKGKEA